MKKISRLLIQTLTLFLISLFFMSGSSNCYWYETERMSIGNGSITRDFIDIPGTPYVINGTKALTIFDITTGRCKGTYSSDKQLKAPVIMKAPESGWDIYFYSYSEDWSYFHLGRLEITEDLDFGNISFYDITSNERFRILGIETRDEVWFAGDKLYCLKRNVQEWITFEYPEGWDPDFSMDGLYLTDDNKNLFVVSFANTQDNLQGALFELESSKFSPIISFDNPVVGIERWKNRQNEKYLIMTLRDLWVYDTETESLNLLLEGFTTEYKSIMQDDTGKYIYAFNKPEAPWIPATDFYILDLENKEVETITYPFEEDYSFNVGYPTINLPYYDKGKQRITTITCFAPSPTYREFRFCYIDLSDFSLNYYTPDLFYANILGMIMCYLPEYQKFIVPELDYKSIIIGEVETGNFEHSIPLSFNAGSWSVIQDSDGPTLISNKKTNEFVHLTSIGRREPIETESMVANLCEFIGGERAFVIEDSGYKEYLLKDGSNQNINLPYDDIANLYPDPNRNQIIGIGDSAVQFIKPRGQVSVWTPSESNITLKAHNYDPDNEAVWMIYQKTKTKEWLFFKVSAQTYTHISTFTLPADSFSDTLNLVVDPYGNYLYFINQNIDLKIRELVIVDIELKQVAKRITLQDEVELLPTLIRVFPGIIPIPSKERLFLWDHYAPWLINTENLEILFGSIKTNPISALKSSQQPIMGVWNEEDDTVLVVDLNEYNTMDPDDVPAILKLDANTGEIKEKIDLSNLSSIRKFFFPGNTNKVCLLTSSNIYTYDLDPAWEEPARIEPSTNYIQFGEGDECRFSVNIKNEYDYEQKATAYIWLIAPDGTMLFFDGLGFTPEISGIPLTLPSNLDVTADFLTFTMPRGAPEGFYNLNAVFINDAGDRGPIGTWNFYVKD